MKLKKIIAVIAVISSILMFSACGGQGSETSGSSSTTESTGVEDGVLTVAMECTYAPYNWTQADDSNGAVPISNAEGSYAYGYDVMMAKKICEEYGWELEIVQTDWDSLVPGVQSGTFDCVIAGQSMTKARSEQVDFAGPYYYATTVILTKADSEYADATSIQDLSGGKCTAQISSIHYEKCLPQIEGAQIQAAAETVPAELIALESGTVDFVCLELPAAMSAVKVYPDLKILDFSGTDGDFQFTDEERAEYVNLGISVKKGNTYLKDAIDAVLDTMTTDDFDAMMQEAVDVQPINSES
ncbi:MAG: transporter substrate-binding domain-containing protein [Oscillospiraceae bacterium]